MVSCVGGWPARVPALQIATEQADPEVSIANNGAGGAVEVEAAFIEWLACAGWLSGGLCASTRVC
jgi:hypothetical protein